MKAGVIVFPGSNCDHDAWYAIAHNLGHQAEFIWHQSTSLGGVEAILLPGGFSYGDYLRSGAIRILQSGPLSFPTDDQFGALVVAEVEDLAELRRFSDGEIWILKGLAQAPHRGESHHEDDSVGNADTKKYPGCPHPDAPFRSGSTPSRSPSPVRTLVISSIPVNRCHHGYSLQR